jgi:hypothetical protein
LLELFLAYPSQGINALTPVNRLDRHQHAHLRRDMDHRSDSRQARKRLIESDLPLSIAKGFSFVSHSKCRESQNCSEQKTTWNVAAAQTLAFLFGNGIHCVDHLLRDGSDLNSEAESYVIYLWSVLGRNKDRFGGALKKSKSTKDVLLGALALYGSGQHAAAIETVKTIKSQDIFTDALTGVIRRHFALPKWQMPG